MVGQAADKGFITTYTHDACYVTSNKGAGNIVLMDVRTNKLYKLAMKVDQPASQANVAITHYRKYSGLYDRNMTFFCQLRSQLGGADSDALLIHFCQILYQLGHQAKSST